jgi:hypothetical protein
MPGAVLVLTQKLDATADLIINELNQRGEPVIRADLSDIVVAAELDRARWVGTLTCRSRTVRLEEINSVYYRRPTVAKAPSGTDPRIGEWIETETRWGWHGLMAALPQHRWLNWPPAVRTAEYKPFQLVEAARSGLRVPRTSVTNIPEAAARFVRDSAPVLYKAFRNRPVAVGDTTTLTYATPVEPEQCDTDSIRAAPIMLQSTIKKEYDVRVIYLDGETFAVSPRHRDGGIPLDWRIDHNANRWQAVSVPFPVQRSLEIMLTRLGLRFASCDFAVDRGGTWWFLDLNPAGQWAWEHPRRESVIDAIADTLTEEMTTL